MKQFVLDLTVNAVKNMQLVAGDDSPAYNDAAEKESVDLSNIRNDYGVDEAVRDDNKESLFLNAVQDIIAQAEEVGAYGDVNDESIKRAYSYFQKGDAAGAAEEILSSFSDQDGGEVAALQGVYDDAVAELKAMMNSSVGEDKEEDDDDSWIPSEDEFDQEVKHGYKGRTTEGFSSEADQVLAQVGSGELDAYDVMSNPKGPAQAEAAEIIQSMYNDVSIDNGLHPDDDFEKILDIVADQLAADYGNSDADTREAVESTSTNALEAAMFELRKLAGLR
jgi:hypothetical protein